MIYFLVTACVTINEHFTNEMNMLLKKNRQQFTINTLRK